MPLGVHGHLQRHLKANWGEKNKTIQTTASFIFAFFLSLWINSRQQHLPQLLSSGFPLGESHIGCSQTSGKLQEQQQRVLFHSMVSGTKHTATDSHLTSTLRQRQSTIITYTVASWHDEGCLLPPSPVKADCKYLIETWIYASEFVLWSSNLPKWVLTRSGILLPCQVTQLKTSFDIKLFTNNPSFLFAGLAPEQGKEHLKKFYTRTSEQGKDSVWESKAGLYFMEYQCWSKTLWSLSSTARELPCTEQTADALTNYY